MPTDLYTMGRKLHKGEVWYRTGRYCVCTHGTEHHVDGTGACRRAEAGLECPCEEFDEDVDAGDPEDEW